MTRQIDALAAGLFILLSAGPTNLADRTSAREQLPGAIGDSLEQLKASFHGASAGNVDMMRIEVESNTPAIEGILAYAAASPENADTLADYLCESLGAYAEAFKPGSEIDERILTTQSYKRGTEPEYGVSAEAYLLLEVAKQKGSPIFTRRALRVLYDVMQAHSYLAEQRTRRRTPGADDEWAREKREFGGFLTTLGGEIAWCCEQFMVRTYLSDEPHIPDAGLTVINEYWKWRKDTMVEWGRPYCLHRWYQHRTMEYVRRLVEALPAHGDP